MTLIFWRIQLFFLLCIKNYIIKNKLNNQQPFSNLKLYFVNGFKIHPPLIYIIHLLDIKSSLFYNYYSKNSYIFKEIVKKRRDNRDYYWICLFIVKIHKYLEKILVILTNFYTDAQLPLVTDTFKESKRLNKIKYYS